MTDREKIVKELYDLRRYLEDKEWSDNRVDRRTAKVYWQTVTDAIAMLKEQEAKPITYTDNPYTKLPVAHCPKCWKFARQFHTECPGEETKYCPWCGQLLKWEEDDG